MILWRPSVGVDDSTRRNNSLKYWTLLLFNQPIFQELGRTPKVNFSVLLEEDCLQAECPSCH